MKDCLVVSPAVDLQAKRELNNGFGDTLARAFEFAVTPVIFGFIGHLLDGWLGTSPLLLLVFAGFAVAGMSVKLYYAYDQAMEAQSEGRPWARAKGTRAAKEGQ
jgi:F0F1-type ATP synthase assembly protein I